ncbi:hypothetical protein FA95DRAFT_1188577 [Auriscalpium vulgare]|uniref:Uncharacterized protein n=1 Tax=Auriscalpium vulgare TaxID=40419 RepID=A0ACB8R436_9AGAM|nr:hypothetical protein FA95DRAFT_1188577 [Auriscalpium vulgare]
MGEAWSPRGTWTARLDARGSNSRAQDRATLAQLEQPRSRPTFALDERLHAATTWTRPSRRLAPSTRRASSQLDDVQGRASLALKTSRGRGARPWARHQLLEDGALGRAQLEQRWSRHVSRTVDWTRPSRVNVQSSTRRTPAFNASARRPVHGCAGRARCACAGRALDARVARTSHDDGAHDEPRQEGARGQEGAQVERRKRRAASWTRRIKTTLQRRAIGRARIAPARQSRRARHMGGIHGLLARQRRRGQHSRRHGSSAADSKVYARSTSRPPVLERRNLGHAHGAHLGRGASRWRGVREEDGRVGYARCVALGAAGTRERAARAMRASSAWSGSASQGPRAGGVVRKGRWGGGGSRRGADSGASR